MDGNDKKHNDSTNNQLKKNKYNHGVQTFNNSVDRCAFVGKTLLTIICTEQLSREKKYPNTWPWLEQVHRTFGYYLNHYITLKFLHVCGSKSSASSNSILPMSNAISKYLLLSSSVILLM